MFWRFGGYANISTLDSILDKPDVLLEEVLDESDLLQELKQRNSKLIEYVREPKILEQLLNYVIAPKLPIVASDDLKSDETSGKARSKSRSFSGQREEEEDEKEKKRNRYAYISAELLSSDTWSITESLLENEGLLRKFWEFLKLPAPLDPLQASYFTKVNETLLDKKTEEMLGLFKSIDGVVTSMLQHVDSPMVMDLLLKIISLEKAEGGQGIVDVGALITKPLIVANYSVSVAAFPKPDANITFVPLGGALVGYANLSWRLPEGHHHYLSQCLTKRAVLHWSK